MAEKDVPSADIGSDTSTYDHDVPIDWKPYAKPAFMYVHMLVGEKYFPVHLFQLLDPSAGVTASDITQAIDAINGGHAAIPRGPSGVEWRVLSYMVFVLPRDPDDEFLEPGVSFSHNGTGNNYTFLEPHIDKIDGYPVFYCTNFRRKVTGERLGKSQEKYEWTAHHKKENRSHTDSGQNTGP